VPGIDWSLLRANANAPANIANSVFASFEQGRKVGEDVRKRKALDTFAADPNSEEALRRLIAVAPELGFKAAEYRREQAKAQREQDFGGALTEYMISGGGNALLGVPRSALSGLPGPGSTAPAPSALGEPRVPGGPPPSAAALAPNALAPSAVPQVAAPEQAPQPAGGPQQDGPDLSMLGTPRTGRDHAFLRMVKADPLKALKIQSELRDNFVQNLKDTQEVYRIGAERLSSANDEASYQRVLAELTPMVEAIGGNLLDHVPANYPGRDGLREVLMKALDARQQVSAFMQQANIDEDNERADRNTDSLVEDREERRGETRRYHDAQAGVARRGQDVRADVTRRGQDTRGSRGGRGGSPRVVSVRTPQEAMKLAPGTVFRTPDGRVKVR
jgi:hypothetical protein